MIVLGTKIKTAKENNGSALYSFTCPTCQGNYCLADTKFENGIVYCPYCELKAIMKMKTALDTILGYNG